MPWTRLMVLRDGGYPIDWSYCYIPLFKQEAIMYARTELDIEPLGHDEQWYEHHFGIRQYTTIREAADRTTPPTVSVDEHLNSDEVLVVKDPVPSDD